MRPSSLSETTLVRPDAKPHLCGPIVTDCLMSSCCLINAAYFCVLCVYYTPILFFSFWLRLMYLTGCCLFFLTCYSYTFQLGKTCVISISFSSIKETSHIKLKLVSSSVPICPASSIYIICKLGNCISYAYDFYI